MESLYNIANEYHCLLDQFENEETESKLFEKLEEINDKFDNKIKNITFLISELEEESGIIQFELQRLDRRLSKKRKTIAKLKEYVKSQMEFAGKDKIETPTHTITIKNSFKTEVTDDFIQWALDNNHEDYLEKKVSYQPNKKLIKNDIEGNKLNCPYAKIIKNKNLIIK